METNNTTFSSLLHDALAASGLTFERLHQMTEVPERYLEQLLNGNYDKLPAAPYARGYLMRLAQTLNLSGDELWELYKREMKEPRSSGKSDTMPRNRFAITYVKKSWLFGGIALVALLIYLGIHASTLIGAPHLTLTSPAEGTPVTSEATLIFTGAIDPGDRLTINGEEISVGKSGEFSHTYSLEEGVNTFEIMVARLLGRKTMVIRNVIYEPITEPPLPLSQ